MMYECWSYECCVKTELFGSPSSKAGFTYHWAYHCSVSYHRVSCTIVSNHVSSCGRLIYHSVSCMLAYQIADSIVPVFNRRCHLFSDWYPSTHPVLVFWWRIEAAEELNSWCLGANLANIRSLMFSIPIYLTRPLAVPYLYLLWWSNKNRHEMDRSFQSDVTRSCIIICSH